MLQQNLRLALSSLRRRPALVVMAVVTLALGIGTVTAITSVADSVLLRPLPYGQPDRLVALWESHPAKGRFKNHPSPADYVEWRDHARAFEGVAAVSSQPAFVGLTGAGEPRPITVIPTWVNLFEVLGVKPYLGRDFLPEEEKFGSARVAIMSYRLWQSQFGGDPEVIGRRLEAAEEGYTVVGVMPPGFSYPIPDVDLWIPGWNASGDPATAHEESFLEDHNYLHVVARLAPGVSITGALAELRTIAGRFGQDRPEHQGWEVGLTPLRDWVVGESKTTLVLLLGAVSLVLLIACANVVNLLLVRSGARAGEMAIRAALGARRRQLIGQLLSEHLLLAVLAGVLGAWLGRLGLRVLLAWSPADIPRLHEASLDHRVLLIALGVTLATTLVFGIVPAIAGSKHDLGPSLRGGGRGPSASRRQRASHRLLVVAEVALACLLVAGAGLLIRSFQRLYQSDPGFEAERILAVRFLLPRETYPDEQTVEAFFDRLVERVRELPGVAAASTELNAPLLGPFNFDDLIVEGREDTPLATLSLLTGPGFFETMALPLLRGRVFTGTDDEDAPRVAIIDAAFARRQFGGDRAIGQRVAFYGGAEAPEWRTVVGVVADLRVDAFTSDSHPMIYVPFRQWGSFRFRDLLVRSADTNPGTLVPSIRETVLSMDDDLPLMGTTTLVEAFSSSLERERFVTLLVTSFGTIALLLAGIGTYGVLATTVQQRRREIGIRMALGADRHSVVSRVVREGMGLVAAGCLLGGLGLLAVAPVLSPLLYGIRAGDGVTLAVVSVVLLGSGLVACLVPARRAAGVDPITTLRYE